MAIFALRFGRIGEYQKLSVVFRIARSCFSERFHGEEMNKTDREFLKEVVSAFSAVIVEITRSVASQSQGTVSRQTIGNDLQRAANQITREFSVTREIYKDIALKLQK